MLDPGTARLGLRAQRQRRLGALRPEGHLRIGLRDIARAFIRRGLLHRVVVPADPQGGGVVDHAEFHARLPAGEVRSEGQRRVLPKPHVTQVDILRPGADADPLGQPHRVAIDPDHRGQRPAQPAGHLHLEGHRHLLSIGREPAFAQRRIQRAFHLDDHLRPLGQGDPLQVTQLTGDRPAALLRARRHAQHQRKKKGQGKSHHVTSPTGIVSINTT